MPFSLHPNGRPPGGPNPFTRSDTTAIGRRRAGGALGRPLELVIEDDQTTNPGVVLAFSKLAGNTDIAAFLGPIRSTQVHAMAPDVLKLGKPVMIGGTDPALTHMGNPWFFRFRPSVGARYR
jgi:branched-chain amino acid transport system substrate-binding protein